MKYLIIGFLILFSGTNLIAQSPSDSIRPKIKMIKEAIYKPENGEIKCREYVLDSKISSNGVLGMVWERQIEYYE